MYQGRNQDKKVQYLRELWRKMVSTMGSLKKSMHFKLPHNASKISAKKCKNFIKLVYDAICMISTSIWWFDEMFALKKYFTYGQYEKYIPKPRIGSVKKVRPSPSQIAGVIISFSIFRHAVGHIYWIFFYKKIIIN